MPNTYACKLNVLIFPPRVFTLVLFIINATALELAGPTARGIRTVL